MNEKELGNQYIHYDGDNHKLFYDVYINRWSSNIVNQSALVTDLLATEDVISEIDFSGLGGFSFDSIENLYMTTEEAKEESEITQKDTLEDYIYDNPKEIFEWYLVLDDQLFNWLKDNGEAVLDTNYGSYWGRCTTGQSIYLDSIFADYVNHYR